MLETYKTVIMWIKLNSGLSDPILHLHAGMIVLLAARLVTRRPLASLVPFAIVVAAELGNEVLDRIILGSWRWRNTGSDVFYTLFWPAVLTIGARYRAARPRLTVRRRR